MELLRSMVQTAQRAPRTEPKKDTKVNTKMHSQIQVNTDGVNVRTMFSGLARPVESHASGHVHQCDGQCSCV